MTSGFAFGLAIAVVMVGSRLAARRTGIPYAVPTIGFVAAFVLGSVVAPTDPVAATSVLERLGGPPRLTTVLEGESLVNDGIALALLALGLESLTHPTGVAGAAATFAKLAGGGVGFGLVIGWLASRVRKPVRDPAAEVVISLVVPYAAYLPANALGLSGVLATLTTGLVLGQRGLHGLDPAGRIRVTEFWQVLSFLLESVLFVLVGLELRVILTGLGSGRPGDAAVMAGVTVGVVVVVRLLWWLAVPTLRWRPEGRIIDTGGVPWQSRVVLGWSGLRGAISLAAALSIPLMESGKPFPDRNIVVFSAFCVVLFTLVGEGTTLPWLVRRLGLAGSEVEQRQHALAGRRCAEAALVRLDEIAADEDVRDEVVDVLRQVYERRLERARSQLDVEQTDGARASGPSVAAVHHRLLERQRVVLQQLHREGQVSFAVMRQVGRELDLEQASLER